MVIMNINLEEYKLRRKNPKAEPKIYINEFGNEEKRKKYAEATKCIELPDASPQEKWQTIVAECKKAGELILGKRERNIRLQDPVLKKLADDKQKTKRDINAAKNQEIRKQKCQKLRTIKK